MNKLMKTPLFAHWGGQQGGVMSQIMYRAGRDDVTTGKLFPSRGEALGLYRCVLIIFKRK